MPRKLIKRFLPDHHKIRDHKHLKCFGTLLHDPNIWHLNRRSVSGAFSVGLFCAWIPIPFQMLVAAAVAIMARVNLPISVTLVWVTNPITIPPMYYYAYKLGTWILDSPSRKFTFELSFTWLKQELGYIWEPFLLGCLILGLASGISGFLLARILWRLHIFRYIKQRRLRKMRKSSASRR